VEYWTIEVLDAEYAAAAMWRTAYGERLAETAVTHGAKEWGWGARDWGVIFEVAFADEADWLHFRATPAVCAALDAVPDPVNGLLVYSGRRRQQRGRRAPPSAAQPPLWRRRPPRAEQQPGGPRAGGRRGHRSLGSSWVWV
jgi:hypothetical protein